MINITVRTVKELKELIKDLPNDRKDMKTNGYRNGVYTKVEKMVKETKSPYDRFDYTNYAYEVYTKNEEGEETLIIQ